MEDTVMDYNTRVGIFFCAGSDGKLLAVVFNGLYITQTPYSILFLDNLFYNHFCVVGFCTVHLIFSCFHIIKRGNILYKYHQVCPLLYMFLHICFVFS